MSYTDLKQVEWTIEHTFELDVDGHGTREVGLVGHTGNKTLIAIASHPYPYNNGEFENIVIDDVIA